MSWLDELQPAGLAPRRVLGELRATWRSARADGDARPRAFAHVGLRLVQTLAYAAGWAMGGRRRDE